MTSPNPADPAGPGAGGSQPPAPPAADVPPEPPLPAALRPTGPAVPVHPDDVRVGDAEREVVAALLGTSYAQGRLTPEEYDDRSSLAYAARTRADLDRLTVDLPGGAVPATRPPSAPWAAATTGSTATAAGPMVAIFSGAERKGVWTAAASETALAVFGGVVIDFRHAVITSPVVEVQAVAIFGGVEITVPEGWQVEMTGFAIFGGREAKIAPAPVVPGSPVVRVNAFALFGGVSVTSKGG